MSRYGVVYVGPPYVASTGPRSQTADESVDASRCSVAARSFNGAAVADRG